MSYYSTEGKPLMTSLVYAIGLQGLETTGAASSTGRRRKPGGKGQLP